MPGIVQVCSLCGHPYERMSDEDAMSEHMARVHGLYFDPGEIFRRAPAWRRVTGEHATLSA
jgi:hypothetical protein